MSNNNETIFAEGVFAFRNQKSPDFVVTNLTINLEEFAEFAEKHKVKNEKYKNMEVKLTVLKSKNSGKPYVVLDTFKPKPQGGSQAPSDDFSDDVPF